MLQLRHARRNRNVKTCLLPSVTWTKLVEEESVMVGVSREGVLCRSKWIVGFNLDCCREMWILFDFVFWFLDISCFYWIDVSQA